MATLVNFFQPPLGPFKFQATFDNNPYFVTVPYIVFGQRYYIKVVGAEGTFVLYRSLVGSPTGISSESIVWNNGSVTLRTSQPHLYAIGQTVLLAVTGCLPDSFNGTYRMLVSDAFSFTYQTSVDPGIATTYGKISHDVNLVAGYFKTASLVFRSDSQQFEIR